VNRFQPIIAQNGKYDLDCRPGLADLDSRPARPCRRARSVAAL